MLGSLAESGPARRPQSALPDPVHQLPLQHEVRALLLLAAAESAGRSVPRRDRRAVRGAGSDREPQPVRGRAVPPQGVRRHLPAVRPAQRGEGDLRPHQRLLHRREPSTPCAESCRKPARGSSPSSCRSMGCPSFTTSSARPSTPSGRHGDVRRAGRAPAGGRPAPDPRDLDGHRLEHGGDPAADDVPLRPLPADDPPQPGHHPRRSQEPDARRGPPSRTTGTSTTTFAGCGARGSTAGTARSWSPCCNGSSSRPPSGNSSTSRAAPGC